MKRLTECFFILFLLVTLTVSGTPAKQALAETSETDPLVYDLIVVGSDPEGIAAAISGARNGLATLLIDTRPQVGGLMTRGWLNVIDMNLAPCNYGPRLDILNKGIFLEFYRHIGNNTFDVNTAQQAFDRMIAKEANLQLLLSVKSYAPVIGYKGGKPVIQGVKVEDPQGQQITYSCKRAIDATQDGNLAATAGVPFSVGQEDYGFPERKMATTLVFKLGGITSEDWKEIHTVLNEDNDWFSGASHISAWGFGDIMEKYRPTNSRIGVRGLNIGKQKDGTVLINALHIFDVDSLNQDSRKEARQLAEKELPQLTQYIKENVPGFKNCTLAAVAPELYIRESRHIYGEYRLTIDDVLENRDFPDRIAFGSYAVDVQASGPREKGAVMGVPAQYAVPFRCLVPQKVDNLLVVGRAASFDSLPHGSARLIPVGMATGEAAGAAAALSLEEGMTFREMTRNKSAIYNLQERLNNQGMVIKPFEWPPHAVCSHWAYDGLKLVRKHALIQGGYSNQYQMDEVISEGEFMNLLQSLAHLYGIQLPEGIHEDWANESSLSAKEAAELLTLCFHRDVTPQEVYDRIFKNQGGTMLNSLEENRGKITHGTAYVLLKDYIMKHKTKTYK